MAVSLTRAPAATCLHTRRPAPCAPILGGRSARASPRRALIARAAGTEEQSASTAASSAPPAAGQVAPDLADLSQLTEFFGAEELAKELNDGSEFGTRGEALVAGQIALIALVAFAPSPIQSLLDATGGVCLIAGSSAAAYSFFGLGKSLSPLPVPRKVHTLITDGAFAYARHPLYGGLLMSCCGLSLVTHSVTRFALTVALWYLLDKKSDFEETELTKRYPDYPDYAASVKKFIPWVL
ncbi:hypothetical protein FOA52_009184 [Chlamydomonas sp. UWO 241]|nr:hypothetical protein FOA52_009184 [Chlamydomonas sp. UWO 241]